MAILQYFRRIYLIEDVTVLCIYLKQFVLFDKASVDLYLFMIYLRILSVSQAMWLQVIGWTRNSEQEMIWKEAVV